MQTGQLGSQIGINFRGIDDEPPAFAHYHVLGHELLEALARLRPRAAHQVRDLLTFQGRSMMIPRSSRTPNFPAEVEQGDHDFLSNGLVKKKPSPHSA